MGWSARSGRCPGLALFFVRLLREGLDGCGPSLALGLPGAEDEDGLAVLLHDLADERVGRLDLEPFRTPAALLARGRVAAADQVDPERVGNLGGQFVRLDR